jgi:hypothetical protein
MGIISRMKRWPRHITRIGEMRNAHILAGKTEGKISIGRHRHDRIRLK